MISQEHLDMLSEELSLNPELLKRQLTQSVALYTYIVEEKRQAMISNSKEKGLLSDYQKVLDKKISAAQTLLGLAKEEVKRAL